MLYNNSDQNFTMSMGSDSLLSSISNVSVLIKHGEGSSVFNLSLLPNNQQNGLSDRPCQVKLEDIFPFQYSHHNSILDPLIKREEPPPHFYPTHTHHQPSPFNEHSWTITQLKGVSQDECSPQEEEEKSEPVQKKNKNETKNIPKNYGKAIITFIEKYKDVVKEVCESIGVNYEEFFSQMGEIKKRINTIADLRYLWMDYRYSQCMRILSNLFLRKYSLNYIFNSRICNYKSHIKYRHRLSEAVKNPTVFRHIKDY